MTPTGITRAAPLLAAFVFSTAAQAQDLPPPANLSPGAYLMIARSYDSDKDIITDGAPAGEGEACFQVVEHTPDGVVLRQETGTYQPWWSEAPILPGSSDVWFSSDGWRANNPGAGILDELKVIFTNVPSCEGPRS